MELLILLTVLLTLIAVAKVLRAKELVDSVKDPEAEKVSAAEIKTNALGMLIWGVSFLILVVVMVYSWNKYTLPASGSVHGEEIDTLMRVTWYLIFTVFFITHILLFFFVFKYQYDPTRKAFWYPHNNKLELLWTIVPASVLILLITYGMSTWHDVMNQEEEENAIHLEFVSEQFRWTARYAGEDRVLGEASFALYGKNSVGVATEVAMKDRIAECEESLKLLSRDSLAVDKLVQEGWNKGEKLSDVKQSIKNYRTNIYRINRMLEEHAEDPSKFDAGSDDLVINSDSVYLPKGRQVILQLRSKDVIHSAYFPHFRVQMNTVPGMNTSFSFTPRYTNEEMLEVAKGQGKGFTGYILLCNKICGTSHFNMKMNIRVVEPDVYEEWIAKQTKFAEAFQ